MINDLNARKAYMWKYVDITISEVVDKVQDSVWSNWEWKRTQRYFQVIDCR